MTAPGMPGSAALVRLVAAREMSTRIRDKTFLITSGVILVLVLGGMAFQVLIASGADKVTIGVVGDQSALEPALQAQGRAVGADVTVVGETDETGARTALRTGDETVRAQMSRSRRVGVRCPPGCRPRRPGWRAGCRTGRRWRPPG